MSVMPVADIDRRYHHGALREALLDVGLSLLRERNMEELSLREIARRVGVSATAVYRHFPDKGALLAALSQQGLEQLARAQREAFERAGGGSAGFSATGHAYVTFALENATMFRLILTHPPTCDPLSGKPHLSGAMGLLLENATALAPAGVDPVTHAMQSWAVVHGLAMLMLDGQMPTSDVTIRAVLGIRAATPTLVNHIHKESDR